MAKMELSLTTILIVAAVIWIVGFGGLATIQGWFAVSPAPAGGQPVDGIVCPDTLNTNYDGDVVNSLDSAATSYIAAVHRFIPDGNFNQYITFTSGTAAAGGTAINLRCGKSYVAYLLPAQDGELNPLAPINFGVVEGNDASRVISATNFSVLTANAYDNIARGLVWDTEDTDNAAGEYDVLAAHFDSTTNNTAITLGVGDTLDWDLGIKTTMTNSYFGNSAEGVYIAVDADKTDYDTPLVQIAGVNLVDVKDTGEVGSDDLATLSSYEYVFKVPAGVNFNSAPTTVRFFVAGKSGQNADADIVLRFVAKAHYVGNDGYTIYKDIFNRASAAEILTATAQTITIDVQ